MGQVNTATNYVTEKTHSNNKKIILTILILLLTLAISLIAVFAYITADFTVSNNVSFRAQEINAFVRVEAQNGLKNVELDNNSFDIKSTDAPNTFYGVEVPRQDFAGTGLDNAIVYTTYIKNTGSAPFKITLGELMYENLTITREFYKVESFDENGSISLDKSMLVSNSSTISNGQMMVIKVSITLNMAIETSHEIAMVFTLEAYSESV